MNKHEEDLKNPNERDNHEQLMAFLHANIEKTRDGAAGLFSFRALVVYHHAITIKTFQTGVRVETDAWNGGKVSLDESDQCPSAEYHLDFQPKFQAMNYNRESNNLVISGTSQKMGDYKVTLSAL